VTDWGQLYRDNVEALSKLAADLTAEQLSTRVPATPEWDVHDVLAHLAGGGQDVLSDRMDDAPSPAWTERHVQERSARSADELVSELTANVEALVARIGPDNSAIVFDVAVHHADLHEALGHGRVPEPLWHPVLEAIQRVYGDAAPTLRDQVDDYELFRAVFSRRSTSQLDAWGLDGVTVDQLESACIFGPRSDDQPVPTA
jgi:uncharacterized protein (TIGR03083 family)